MPDFPNDAQALRERGEIAAARARCEARLRDAPDDARALDLMAALAADEGDNAGALGWAQRALAADPRLAAAHYTLGRIHQAEGRAAQAEASYLRSLQLDPGQARAYNNLGCVQQTSGRLEAAIQSFRRALALDPELPQSLLNLASLTGERRLLARSAANYRRQAGLNPRDALVCHDLGNVYRELGQLDAALAWHEEALRRDPECAEAHFARGLVLLLQGRLAEGWAENEWRFRAKALGTPAREPLRSRWDGSDLGGRTLLLHAEQGLGDSILFARYASLAARRCGRLIVECPASLKGLLATVEGVDIALAQGEPLPPFDAHLSLVSLPRIFGTTLESIPWSGPYLRVDPGRMAHWRRLRSGTKRLVGLAWAGQPGQGDDRKRSLALAALAPLAAAPGIRFVSLQKGAPAAQAKDPPAGLELVDETAALHDLMETAALMANLDLVVSVDTSVANLAGAMGLPAWVLLSRVPDWRWLLGRETTPWYPTLRLLRQQGEGDWAPVVARLAVELARLP